MARPAVDWLNQAYLETCVDPSIEIAVSAGHLLTPYAGLGLAPGLVSSARVVHTAGVARIALLIGRVRRLFRPVCHRDALHERQHDEQRREPSVPVLILSELPDPASLLRARISSIVEVNEVSDPLDG